MSIETESSLEDELIKNLQDQGFECALEVVDEASMLVNLRKQLEKFNSENSSKRGSAFKFTDNEWGRLLIELQNGKVFDKAQRIRTGWTLERDDGTLKNIFFLDNEHQNNIFQVTHQLKMQGAHGQGERHQVEYQNRYDVTILVNGLPLIQIELKRRGGELKEAFNQVNRYRRQSYSAGFALMEYVQMFIISNGVNTKYYANQVGSKNSEKSSSFDFTCFWADEQNNKYYELPNFTREFLTQVHLTNMLTKYTVLSARKEVLLLRSYQIHAVRKVLDAVPSAFPAKTQNDGKGGYIWHTTGSGKTLTSFKAAQLLTQNKSIDKVLFVVDRNDLDSQTRKEFNRFKEDSVDDTSSTKELVEQLEDSQNKLIVTTIQKMQNALSRSNYLKKMESFKDKRVVFIFDECHRSQFGTTHRLITSFFTNYQLFGFTGTPIFAENAIAGVDGQKQTTKNLFGNLLHSYVITDAIHDENVLRFVAEQVGKYSRKESKNEIDILVEDIDTKELLESGERVEKIVRWIIANHSRKTHSKQFNAIMATASVEMAVKYYNEFQRQLGATQNENLDKPQSDSIDTSAQSGSASDLKIASIFTYGVNENDKNADSDLGTLDEDELANAANSAIVNEHSRESLERVMGDYNQMFGTNFKTTDQQGFKAYREDISKKMKNTEIDILIVVNMYLTGFDAPKLNTLYVDKNLRYHGLIQAYSRTNRILNETKSHGNIVSFRNLKDRQDEALALFADKGASADIFVKPYEEVLADFDAVLASLRAFCPEYTSVDSLVSEDELTKFVKIFRELLRLKNALSTYADFELGEHGISAQEFANYQSKYLDLYERVKREPEAVSVLSELSFEIELTHRDEVNVAYILRLIGQLAAYAQGDGAYMQDNRVDAHDGTNGEAGRAALLDRVMPLVRSSEQLRYKSELIEEFINSGLGSDEYGSEFDADFDVDDAFNHFISIKFEDAIIAFADKYKLHENLLREMIQHYQWSGVDPLVKDFRDLFIVQPSILALNKVIKEVRDGFTRMMKVYG